MPKLITLFGTVLAWWWASWIYIDVQSCLFNQSNEPTFITKNRSEVIDITACNTKCITYTKDWRVSNEITLSDHRLIRFSITGPANIKQDNRNPRKTYWGFYMKEVEEATSLAFGKFSTIVNLELYIDQLQQTILQSYYRSCKAITTKLATLVPWWSKEISIGCISIVGNSLIGLRVVIRMLIKVPSLLTTRPSGMPKGIPRGNSVMRLGMFHIFYLMQVQ